MMSDKYHRLKEKSQLSAYKFEQQFDSFEHKCRKDGEIYRDLKKQSSHQIQSLQRENAELLGKL